MGASRRAAPLLLLLCILPSASATPIDATLSSDGPLHFSNLTFNGATSAAFAPDARSWTTFTLTGAAVHVLEVSSQEARAQAPLGPSLSYQVDNATRSYTLHDVTITLRAAGDKSYLGLYPANDGELQVVGATRVASRLTGSIGNGIHHEDEPREQQRTYYRTVDSPHLLLNSTGAASYTGAGSVKLADVLLAQTSRNASFIDTRFSRAQAPAGVATDRWVILTFTSATIHLETSGSFQALTPGGSYESAGSIRAMDGFREWVETSSLAGTFTGTLSPTREAGRAFTRMSVAGTLDTSPMQSQGAALSTPLAGPRLVPLLGLGLGAVLVAAGAAAGVRRLAHRKKGTRPRLVVQEVDALLDRANILEFNGDIPGALAAYDEADRDSPNGLAAFSGAMLAARQGPFYVDDARDLLGRALAKTPDLVNKIAFEPALETLVLEDPSFEDMVNRALRALDAQDGGRGAVPPV